MFSGLMSRWMTPASCAASRPRQTSTSTGRISSGGSGSPGRRWFERGLPWSSSMARKSRPLAGDLPGVEHLDDVLVGELADDARLAVEAPGRAPPRREAGTIFTATVRPSTSSCACHTLPIPPSPMGRSRRKRPPATTPRPPQLGPPGSTVCGGIARVATGTSPRGPRGSQPARSPRGRLDRRERATTRAPRSAPAPVTRRLRSRTPSPRGAPARGAG